jgi:hypothetical protein
MNIYLKELIGDRKGTETFQMTKDESYTVDVYCYNGIKVLIGPMIYITGEIYGCSLDTKTKEHYVGIDKELTLNASKEEMEFFFHHEIGHAINEHLTNGTQARYDDNVVGVAQAELEADAYSVSVVGTEIAIKGLLNSEERFKSEFGMELNDDDSMIIENNLRINAIKSIEKVEGGNVK